MIDGVTCGEIQNQNVRFQAAVGKVISLIKITVSEKLKSNHTETNIFEIIQLVISTKVGNMIWRHCMIRVQEVVD